MLSLREQHYQSTFQFAQDDPRVLGFFLGGSRGKGCPTADSDYDMYIIVKDVDLETVKQHFGMNLQESQILTHQNDVMIYSLSEFELYAEWGTVTAGDAYNFTHNRALIDKTGSLQRLIDRKGKLPTEKWRQIVEEDLDAYYNFYYRALKCDRDHKSFGMLIETNLAIKYCINTIFHLHGRIPPYGKYFVWELEQYPLEKIPWTSEELITTLTQILTSGDIVTQHRLFCMLDSVLIREGFSTKIASWGLISLTLMRTLHWD